MESGDCVGAAGSRGSPIKSGMPSTKASPLSSSCHPGLVANDNLDNNWNIIDFDAPSWKIPGVAAVYAFRDEESVEDNKGRELMGVCV